MTKLGDREGLSEGARAELFQDAGWDAENFMRIRFRKIIHVYRNGVYSRSRGKLLFFWFCRE